MDLIPWLSSFTVYDLLSMTKRQITDTVIILVVCGVIIYSAVVIYRGLMDEFGPLKIKIPYYMPKKGNPRVFFDIKCGDKSVGRVEMELFKDACPKTVENFRCLCTGEKGEIEEGDNKGKKLHFKGSVFHRVISKFMCQGGDITNGDGTGGASIYGDNFKDETFRGKCGRHFGPGTLAMANRGEHTNSSQFFITTHRTYWLDGVNIVLGQVIRGYEVIQEIEKHGSYSGKTEVEIKIEDCGEL
eukprot:Tbor_TRINITY_DN5332_c2_g7::TRINITY_DN5332_c2_g7_i2::g.5175::m.5175/K01802/E5.2.1.8; peptidylprolyl isomerase